MTTVTIKPIIAPAASPTEFRHITQAAPPAMERPISRKRIGDGGCRLVAKARIGLREHIHNSRGNRPVGSPSALLCERNRITF